VDFIGKLEINRERPLISVHEQICFVLFFHACMDEIIPSLVFITFMYEWVFGF
jgi:hypothetical protein